MSEIQHALLFVEIAQRGSISAAARATHVTRATAARRLAALEESLGVQLVTRTTRELSLTSAGEAYLPHAIAARDALARASDAALHAAASPHGLLRVVAPIIDTQRLLLPLLVSFEMAYPDVDVELVLDADVRELVAGGFDVGLQVGLDHNSELVMRRLLVDDMILIASPSYLKRRGTPARVEDLDAHDALLATGQDGLARPWTVRGGTSYTPSRVKLLTNSHDLVHEAARAGMGIGMTPRVLARGELERGELAQVLPELVLYEEWFSLVYSATRIVPPKVRAFIDFTTEHAHALFGARGRR